ncbi:MAG TPA: hypothetical protein VKB27_16245 [Gammaproteobacteria bacterium]|nr:hypothetical protein [Gammaproteobacteria bacterium]
MTQIRACSTSLLAVVVLALSACATTRPVHEWRDDKFSGPIDSVLVIAAIERTTQRRVYEDLFAQALQAFDTEAIPGYSLMTSQVELSRATVEAAVRGRAIDAVLVTRLLGVEQVEAYEPPTAHVYYRNYHRYYEHALTETSPAYYRRYKVLSIETVLYDTASGELIWSMQSESIEPSTPRHLIEEQIDLTIARLNAQGLLSEKQ